MLLASHVPAARLLNGQQQPFGTCLHPHAPSAVSGRRLHSNYRQPTFCTVARIAMHPAEAAAMQHSSHAAAGKPLTAVR